MFKDKTYCRIFCLNWSVTKVRQCCHSEMHRLIGHDNNCAVYTTCVMIIIKSLNVSSRLWYQQPVQVLGIAIVLLHRNAPVKDNKTQTPRST